MKKAKILRSLTSILILCALLANMTSCLTTIKAESLMDGIEPRHVAGASDLGAQNITATDFAVRLFKAAAEDGKSTLISPLSVMYALAMTANGAKGNTLSEMEAVLGMKAEELNLYLYSYMNSLPRARTYKLNLANSIWFTDSEEFAVNYDFLQTNADFYGSDIYKAPFDKSTLKDINNWVKKKTDGMIPSVLDEIPEIAVMYLVNALTFEAEWEKVYEKKDVSDATFTCEDGTTQSVELMYSTEGKYLADDLATGFIKYYDGKKYAFAALLPNEGVSVADYIDGLDGAILNSMLKSAESTTVHAAIPKFDGEYSKEMSEILRSMGMRDAFDPIHADFSGLGTSTVEGENIYITSVLHKTFIEVAEKGTKAGAATVIEMSKFDTAPDPDTKYVYLDKPFVYMLIDCENNLPFFIGTVMSINS